MQITRNVTKKIASAIVGFSTGWTVKNVISNNTSPKNKVQETEALVGGVVLGGLAAEASKPYTDRKVDEFFDAIAKIRRF